MRVTYAFEGPVLQFEHVLRKPHRPGLLHSEHDAIAAILDTTEFRALTDTLETRRGRVQPNGENRSGPTAKYGVDLLLGIVVIALLLGVDLRAARHRLYSDDALRELFGLPPLTSDQIAGIRSLPPGKLVRDKEFVSEEAVRHFASTWLERHEDAFFPCIQDLSLRVVAHTVHRHDLPTNWIAIDGTRALASTQAASGDEGTAVHSRTGKEKSFNQRHRYLAVLGSVPLVVHSDVSAPISELVYWVERGLPATKAAGEQLAALIDDFRRHDGDRESAPHDGFNRAALASDYALRDGEGPEAVVNNGFVPAILRTNDKLKYQGSITCRRNGVPTQYAVRSDGGVMCPRCTRPSQVTKRQPMQPLAGDFGRNIRVKCTDPTCANTSIAKIPLNGPDLNDWFPGTTASRGQRKVGFVSMLPTWSPEYSARRFLATQHIEWTHAQFERIFRLGEKNKSFGRRKLKGSHRNRVWWSLASLLWNMIIRANLDSGAEVFDMRDNVDQTAENAKRNQVSVQKKLDHRKAHRRAEEEKAALRRDTRTRRRESGVTRKRARKRVRPMGAPSP